MSLLAAGDVTLDWGVVQWLIGLALLAAGSITTGLVSKALDGRALKQFQEWKTKTIEESLPSRTAALEASAKEFKDADVLGRIKDLERTVEEIETWRPEATQQLEDIAKETYAEEKVKEALASSASTTKGTQPYRKADR